MSNYFDEDIAEPPVFLGPGGWIDIPEGQGIGVRTVQEHVLKRTIARERLR